MKLRTSAAVAAALTMAMSVSLPQVAFADSERMQLHCESGSLAGRTLERSNGASWWDVEDGTVYTTRSIRVTDGEGNIAYQHDYGRKSGDAGTCVGEHSGPGFSSEWEVTLVPAGGR